MKARQYRTHKKCNESFVLFHKGQVGLDIKDLPGAGFDPRQAGGFRLFWADEICCVKTLTLSLPSDPFKPFIIFSNRHEIRRIELHKGEFNVLVPGLRNTIALDFHLNQSTLYWTDVVEDKIYRGKLSENGGESAS